MLNYRQHIFIQTVAIVLAFTFTIAPAALHTHLSGHELDRDQQCRHCYASDESTCDCCQTNNNCHEESDHESDQSHHKCHCWCFSSLLSILPQFEIQTGLMQQPFYLIEFYINIPQVERNIFRPPRS